MTPGKRLALAYRRECELSQAIAAMKATLEFLEQERKEAWDIIREIEGDDGN